ncbi:hypothetical protein CSB09_04285 [Candidatus Gracilibacteria bacterium]|nr:MAG: hypothetical protein CSB09_04285 [Candidatus Gracilibacteria bacterium]
MQKKICTQWGLGEILPRDFFLFEKNTVKKNRGAMMKVSFIMMSVKRVYERVYFSQEEVQETQGRSGNEFRMTGTAETTGVKSPCLLNSKIYILNPKF